MREEAVLSSVEHPPVLIDVVRHRAKDGFVGLQPPEQLVGPLGFVAPGEVADETTFAGDLEFDSLTVMDFVAAIEDEFDIIISINQQAEIENYGQLVDAVSELAQ